MVASSDESIKIERTAQLKILLHAAKYPYAEVNGVLLGTSGKITDAVPLFHTPMFAPMLETGVAMSDEYAKSIGVEVVGWYHGSSRNNYNGVPKGIARVASKLKGCLVMVDAKLLSDEKESGLLVMKKDLVNWIINEKAIVAESGVEFTKLLVNLTQNKLEDFDSWLDNPTELDWRNLNLLS